MRTGFTNCGSDVEAGVVDEDERILPYPLECWLGVEVDRRDDTRPRQLLRHHVAAQLRQASLVGH